MNNPRSHVLTRTKQQNVTADSDPRLASSSPVESSSAPVIIRFATASDRLWIERLAELDSADVPAGAILIGELRKRPVVAVSLSNGNAVADPFVATHEVLELVRMRAAQLKFRSRSAPLQRVLGRVRRERAA
jgi:hypothetical protein